MGSDGVAKLTEKEREVLRLVLSHDSAKRIAGAIGPDLTAFAVNERLRSARQKLGVSSSRDAARMLARQEGEAYIRDVGDPPQVVPTVSSRTMPPSIGDGHELERSFAWDAVREEQRPFGPHREPFHRRIKLQLPVRRGKHNDLGPWARLGWIGAIAAGTAMICAIAAVFFFGLYISGIDSLGRLGRDFTRH